MSNDGEAVEAHHLAHTGFPEGRQVFEIKRPV
jgi:hypothetical protein